MKRLLRSLIRASAFFRKEMAEVLRQPRLILSLVFGPFLILLLFGVGYRNEARAIRTLFVAQPNSAIAAYIAEQAPNISPQLIYSGVIDSQDEAFNRLRRSEVDLVIVAPENATEVIRNNEQATFEMYHNEIDPAQVSYIQYFGQVIIDEVNRRVLSQVAEQGQAEASDVQQDVRAARESAAAMRSALQAGDVAQAQTQQRSMRTRISAVSLAVGASMGLLSGVQEGVGGNQDANSTQETVDLLNEVQSSPSNTEDIQPGKESYSQEITDLEKTENDLARLEEQLAEFRSVSPQVLTRPFRANSQSISALVLTPMAFFTPGVIVLLLQHIAVTIASLSIVREKRSGALELFRVSPISAAETLLGKYLSYLIFGGFIAAILALLLAFGLNTPMLGNWWNFVAVVAGVLFASIGIGFLISLTTQTESQAVQLAMITLLLSVFFSGFLLDLRYLIEPVRVVSYLMPATYGSILLQAIMLRGQGLIPVFFGGLVGIGVLLLIIDWLLLRRRMRHE